MTIYLERSLVGSDNDDKLTDAPSFVGDSNTDVYLVYPSIYGMAGDDVIRVTHQSPDIFIDAGDGDDNVWCGFNSSGTVYGGAGNDLIESSRDDAQYVIFSGSGNDTVSHFIGDSDTKSRLDGGEGEDHLILAGEYDAARIKGFETLTVRFALRVVKGKLSDFQSVDPDSHTIGFARAADMSDVNFVKGKSSISLFGSTQGDNFDLTGQTRGFSISGGNGADVIIAGAGRLLAEGGSGADYIQGSAKDDILDSGPLPEWGSPHGRETVIAGGGDDIVLFSGSSGFYDGGDGVDTLRVTPPDHDGDLVLSRGDAINFERLDITSFYDLSIDGDLIKQFDTVSAREATLRFSTAVTPKDMPDFKVLFLTLVGSRDGDLLDFTTSKTRLTFDGEGGNDLLRAGSKSVTADGGVGDDRLYGSNFGDTIFGGMGDDILSGGGGGDSINGGHGHDIVHGGAGDDWLQMDQLKASDYQTLYGDGGDDTFFYSDLESNNGSTPWILKKAATLTIDGGGGRDYLTISGNLRNVEVTSVEGFSFYDDIWIRPNFLSSFDFIYPGVNWPREKAAIHLAEPGTTIWKGGWIDAQLIGTSGTDIVDFSKAEGMLGEIDLGAGDDEIRFGKDGNAEDPAVTGGAGDDRFFGGAGENHFWGGTGHDVYVARDNKGPDYFTDFTSSGASADVIDLSGVSAIKDYRDLTKNHLKVAGAPGYAIVYVDMGEQGSLVLGVATDFEGVSSANFLF